MGDAAADEPLELDDAELEDAVDEGAAEDDDDDGSDCAALLPDLNVAAMSSGNLIGLPPADMSTLPSAEMVSGFIAKSVRAYLWRRSSGWRMRHLKV